MSLNKSYDEKIPTHTEAYCEELGSQDQEYPDETEGELCESLTSDDPSPSRIGNSAWTDIRIVQTSDGPENAMFYARSTI